MNTPWGKSQSTEKISINKATVYRVSTSGHGGFLVPKSLAVRMPVTLRNAGFSYGNFYAFEEDCAWSALYLAYPDLCYSDHSITSGLMTKPELLDEATKTFQRYYLN